MANVRKTINFFSGKSIHFLQPYWKKEQWQIALSPGGRKKFSDSPQKLETEFSRLNGTEYAQSFNLGRSAIQFALEGFSLPEASEVILPSFCCTGVITPVIFSGLTPVLVDIDNEFNILASSVKQAITSKTAAIILPHLSGKLARDFKSILKLAHENNLKVIVDASQALGLTCDGIWTGNYGDAGIYSFNGGKLIPGSSGGILVSNNSKIIEFSKERPIASSNIPASDKRITHFITRYGLHRISYPFYSLSTVLDRRIKSIFPAPMEENRHNFEIEHMDPIEAQIAFSQMKFIPEIIEKRRRNALHLIDSGVLHKSGFIIPDHNENVFTKFLVTHEDEKISKRTRSMLIDHGIETEQSYTPLSLREFASSARSLPLPNTDRYWKGAFSIPINPLLKERDMDRIIGVLKCL